ncbi:hypothetical protein ANANG_G00094490 [Anguilla anguilla]|uniref:F-box domain-containing protein n=1 Tax=Anguilla anguilla TaxID=7936 RepID=A0A9D3RYN2_ANGAN|nr:hypothetical protein ANANG_G00094490 [Anguilla anguilla]
MEVGSLPVEVWRLILAYLALPDLGRCSLVCQAWRELILSLDKTRWRQLCLGCPACRHPNWPNRPQLEPASWREALRQHTVASRTWTRHGPSPAPPAASTCSAAGRAAGPGTRAPAREHETLRALSAAGPYDRVVLHPGVYEEQAEVILRVPVEIVGKGKLGEVTLLACMDQQCPTARLCNLVLMPAWFSPVVYKTSSGHVQLDNCNVEGGQLQVRGPGTCQARFCSFRARQPGPLPGRGPQPAGQLRLLRQRRSVRHRGGPAHLRPQLGLQTPGGLGQPPLPPELRTLQEELEQDREAQALARVVLGCLVRRCLFRDGKGGVLVCSHGHARMEGNVFRGLTYAVRCVQNAKIVMLWNEVCGCRASGVFLRLSAAGLIAENNIHSNAEAGLDIRKGANPIVLCNRIHSGLRSGIVVLGNGKGSIRSNQIYGNKEAGIYILYNGNPVVSGNRIFQGQAAGVAVNENGRGLIVENVIWENQWGGVDIRRGGDPVLRNNFICHGYSDGVVVGERGRGLIEGNHIYCNGGCGVWVMSSSLPQLSAGGHDNFNEEGELLAWESDLDSEDERHSAHRPVSVALLEGNYIAHNGAVGLYVKTSEALNVAGNAVHGNKGAGVSVLQSGQLTRLLANCVCGNARAGVAVEMGCQVELRGNGVYDNGGHGVSWRGDGQITENDMVLRNRVQPGRGSGIAVLAQVRGQVQENTLFQSRPGSTKPLLHHDPANSACLLLNNTLRSCSKTSQSDTLWALENPLPRPQRNGQSSAALSGTSAHHATSGSITTRVESGCHNNSSVLCSIL